MKTIKIGKPILCVLVFLCMQFITGIAAWLCCIDWSDPNGMEHVTVTTDAIGWTSTLSGVASVLIIWLALKGINMRETFTPTGAKELRNWWAGGLAIVGAFMGIISTNLVSELLDLPDLNADTFTGLSKSLIGKISIALVAPIVEELIFRESITGHLLRNGSKPLIAIGISSLTFGIIHMNPAQIPFAAIIGFILGLLYYKTGNVILSSIVHIANNTLAVIQMHILGEEAETFKYSEMLGGQPYTILCIILSTALCIALLWAFNRNYVRQPMQ